MSERIAIRISQEAYDAAEAWAEKREIDLPAMVDRLIGAGYHRHLALKNHAERPRDAEGHVKKRLTEGGNKPGWAKRKARREREAAGKQ